MWKRLFKNGVENLKLNFQTSEADLWSTLVVKNLEEEKKKRKHFFD
jgi:hypothetical protein